MHKWRNDVCREGILDGVRGILQTHKCKLCGKMITLHLCDTVNDNTVCVEKLVIPLRRMENDVHKMQSVLLLLQRKAKI